MEPDLAALLRELEASGRPLADLGFGDRELQQLLDSIASPPAAEPDALLWADPITKPGDLWQLGPHRLLCADSADEGSLKRLAGEQTASLLWTDPPYGVDYKGKTAQQLVIANDRPDGLDPLLRRAFRAADRVLLPGAAVYVAHPAGPLAATFLAAFTETGWELRQTLVWVKDTFVLGHSDYHYQHEPILYGYKPGEGRSGRGRSGWYGSDGASSIFQVPRPATSIEHPTMKPIELVAEMLANSCRRGEIVLDPFVGAGATLLAGEQTGRICYGCDIEPHRAHGYQEARATLKGQTSSTTN